MGQPAIRMSPSQTVGAGEVRLPLQAARFRCWMRKLVGQLRGSPRELPQPISPLTVFNITRLVGRHNSVINQSVIAVSGSTCTECLSVKLRFSYAPRLDCDHSISSACSFDQHPLRALPHILSAFHHPTDSQARTPSTARSLLPCLPIHPRTLGHCHKHLFPHRRRRYHTVDCPSLVDTGRNSCMEKTMVETVFALHLKGTLAASKARESSVRRCESGSCSSRRSCSSKTLSRPTDRRRCRNTALPTSKQDPFPNSHEATPAVLFEGSPICGPGLRIHAALDRCG